MQWSQKKDRNWEITHSQTKVQICVFQKGLEEASRSELQQTSSSWRKEEEKDNRKRVCDFLDDEGRKEGPVAKRGERKSSCMKAKPSFSVNIMITISGPGGGDLEAPGGKWEERRHHHWAEGGRGEEEDSGKGAKHAPRGSHPSQERVGVVGAEGAAVVRY